MTIRIAIIVGTTRPGRAGDEIARWVHDLATKRDDAEFELVDLAEVDLPMFDEPSTPLLGSRTRQHTRDWAATVARFDGFVFVTAEYNHGPPAALKNAIDFLYAEWTNKAAGFVGYGAFGGARAVEQLRSTMGEIQVADVSAQVGFGLYTDFADMEHFRPLPHQQEALTELLDQLVAWSAALAPLRTERSR